MEHGVLGTHFPKEKPVLRPHIAMGLVLVCMGLSSRALAEPDSLDDLADKVKRLQHEISKNQQSGAQSGQGLPTSFILAMKPISLSLQAYGDAVSRMLKRGQYAKANSIFDDLDQVGALSLRCFTLSTVFKYRDDASDHKNIRIVFGLGSSGQPVGLVKFSKHSAKGQFEDLDASSHSKILGQTLFKALTAKPRALKRLGADAIRSRLPENIAQMFMKEIVSDDALKAQVVQLETLKPKEMSLHLGRISYLVYAENHLLLGLAKGAVTRQKTGGLSVELESFLPIQRLNTDRRTGTKSSMPPNTQSGLVPQSQPSTPASPTDSHPPILQIVDWLRPIQDSFIRRLESDDVHRESTSIDVRILPRLTQRLRDLKPDYFETVALVGTFFFVNRDEEVIYQTTFAVNPRGRPDGSAILGLKNQHHFERRPGKLGTQIENFRGPSAEMGAAFKLWIEAIRIHGEVAFPLFEPRRFASWLPNHQKQSEQMRLKNAQKQIQPFIDYVVKGNYEAIHLKLQSLSILMRDEEKRPIGFVTLVLDLQEDGSLKATVRAIEAFE